MYRYVFNRVKDTIKDTVNVRKTFACQQTVNNENKKSNNEKCSSVLKYQEINFLTAQHKRVNYEDFRKKYSCRHPNSCNPFLHALTWSTALIAGFYASQLLCLYRRSHHFDPKKSFYAKYLQQKNKLLHRKFLCPQKFVKAQSKSINVANFRCQFNKNRQDEATKEKRAQKTDSTDEFNEFANQIAQLNLFDKRFDKFYKIDDDLTIGGHSKVFYNVNNDSDLKTEYKATSADDNKATDKVSIKSQEEIENEAINEIMTNLSEMIGEMEFQLGVECVLQDNFDEAVEHFRMSSSSNNASACFNLALLYEQGFGVKKDLKIAKRLYQMASEQGHDKADYNLGVYFAKGLGGAKKSFKIAKSYFERAAMHGNSDAIEALSLLNPKKKSIVPDDFIVADDIGTHIVARNIHPLQSIAVS